MAAIYEVWEKIKYDHGNNKPEDTFFVVDSAYDKVKDLSKGKTQTKKIWAYGPATGTNPWGTSSQEDIDQPDIFIVVEKNKVTALRAYGISGKLLFPKDCKRCKNTGMDSNTWGLHCMACNGACMMKL